MEQPKEIGRIKIPIKEIVIGDRVRTELGDIDVLALSIFSRSLLTPIIVHQVEEHKYELVDGYRRIQAYIKLGKKEIDARLFDTLDPALKDELELELCLRRKSLTWEEEARACKKIVMARKKAAIIGNIGRCSGVTRQKDIAVELGMSEAAFSQNLKIADALDAHPELGNIPTKRDVLKAIANETWSTSSLEQTRRFFSETLLVDGAFNVTKSLENKMVDFAILHPTTLDKELVQELIGKIKLGGSFVLFTSMENFYAWKEFISSFNLYVAETPYIWYIKNEDTYIPFLWVGKSREMSLRPMPMHITIARAKLALSMKSKPYNLYSILIKCNTEQGQFVYLPHCEDTDGIRFCKDASRNVRGVIDDKLLYDRMLMMVEKGMDK